MKLEEFKNFYEAEEYHQDYDIKNPKEMNEELIKSGRIFEIRMNKRIYKKNNRNITKMLYKSTKNKF